MGLFRSYGGLARRLRVLLAASAALSVAGCLDIENTARFEPDGAVTLIVRNVFDKEMEDVLEFLALAAKLSPDPKAAPLTSGVCAAISLVGADAPEGVQLTSRQFKDGGKLVCEVRLRAKELPPQALNPGGLGVLTVEDEGPRQKRFELDFERLPDLTPFMMMGMQQQIQQSGQKISNRDAFELLEKGKRAVIAMIAMSARDRYIEVAVSGARIVETDGTTAADGKSARLRLTYKELAELLLLPETRKGRKFSALVSY